VGVVEEAVADRVGKGGIPDEGVPLGDGELAGQDGGTGVVPVVEEFEEVTAILRGERIESPVVDEQDIDAGELGEQAEVGTVGAGQGELVEEAGRAPVERAEALATGLMGRRRRRRRSCQCRSEQQHTAKFPRSVVIHYRWHPLFGQSLTVKSVRRARAGADFMVILVPDGTWMLVPAWMTAAHRCATTVLVEAPVVSVSALLEVDRLLMAVGMRPNNVSMPAEAPRPREEARHVADPSASPVGADVGERRHSVRGAARDRSRGASHAAPRVAAPRRQQRNAGGGGGRR
jgi:hypothetical protein